MKTIYLIFAIFLFSHSAAFAEPNNQSQSISEFTHDLDEPESARYKRVICGSCEKDTTDYTNHCYRTCSIYDFAGYLASFYEERCGCPWF